MKIAVGLIHHPVRDSARKTVATNITNLDVHDIARVCKVYGVERYYVIHPMIEQLMFVERMLDHWRTGDGASYNSMRRTALTMVRTTESIASAVRDWQQTVVGEDAPKPLLVGTTARVIEGSERIDFKSLRAKLEAPGDESLFLLFGTGYGMTEELLRSFDLLLEPMKGAAPLDYRHLSVRSAVSICLDRLLGTW
jgi:hypothetical protein